MMHRKASALNLNFPQGDGQAGARAPEAWLERMRARLDPPGAAATAAAPAGPQAQRAAVLAPLVLREGRLHVILTVRPDDLPRHAGQICFPGGRMHHDDASSAAAALRETHEEIGVAPHEVELLGRWEDFDTIGGFRVSPFAGLVREGAIPRPCPREVAEIFTAPLDFLMDPANHSREWLERDGERRYFTAIRYRHYHIWGATAGMLRGLAQRLG